MTVLLVEDEINLAEIIKESLETRGFTVLHCSTAKQALDYYYAHRPGVVVLDVMLPDADGFAVASQIRTTDMDTPVLFLTARSLPQDVVTGFESGGNDYLKKPFSMEELVVRIKALTSNTRTLYGTARPEEASFTIGTQYAFQYHMCLLKSGQQEIAITGREAELLKLLLVNRNRVVDRAVILMTIWGNDDFFAGRSLDVFITRLRKYLKNDPEVKIVNIRGVGYKLVG